MEIALFRDCLQKMSYDEVDLEDMEWSEGLQAFTYQCPCGDLFQISMVRERLFIENESAWQVASALYMFIEFSCQDGSCFLIRASCPNDGLEF